MSTSEAVVSLAGVNKIFVLEGDHATERPVKLGLRDGTISGDGLETFKLGYQFVRDEIAMRREALQRHANDAAAASARAAAPAHEDNVVVVKTAQSA